MEWLRKEVLNYAKDYTMGGLKDRVRATVTVQKVFKLCIGSPSTAPAKRETPPRGLDWVNYLDTHFGSIVRLSRFYSMLHSGVFMEKVFPALRDDEDEISQHGKEEKSTSKPRQPVWV